MAVGEIDIQSCLAQIRQQDQDAAQSLVEMLYPLVIRIVRSHLPTRTAEEDLAQEIFVKLFQKLDLYQTHLGAFEHWVARLAVRTCLDALRAEKRRPEWRLSDLSEEQRTWLEYMVEDESAPAPDSAPSSARETLMKLLSRLPPEDRLIISLMDLEEKSVKEVVAITGWNICLVKIRAFRARHKLRKLAAQLSRKETE